MRIKQQLLALSPTLTQYFAIRKQREQLVLNLPDEHWQLDHIDNALNNIGIASSEQKKSAKCPLLPALVIDSEGILAFIVELSDGQCTLYYADKPQQTMPLAQLTKQTFTTMWHLTKNDLVETRSHFIQAKEQHWLKPMLQEVKPFYLSLLLGSFTINMLALVIPLFTMNVYDRVVPNAATHTLWVLAIGAFIAILFDWLLKQARTQLADAAGRKIDVKVSANLFAKMMGMKLEQRPQSTGAYAKQLQDFDAVREFLTSATLVSAIDLPFTLLFLILIAWLGGMMVFVPILAMVFIIAMSVLLKNKLNESVEEAAKLSTQKQAHLIEDLNQIIEIKQKNLQGKSQRLWEQTVGQLADWQNQSRATAATLTHSVMTMQQLITIGLIITGVYQIQAGNISMGALIAMVMISSRASASISQIAALILKYKQTTTAMSSIKDILALEQETTPSQHNTPLAPSGELRVNQLNFHYPEQQLSILKNISFAIKAKEKIGIYGNAGSGKSTLLALLAGQYQPSQGQVYYDNIDIKQWHLNHLREHCGWVAQNPSLFYGTVLENIIQNTENMSTHALNALLTSTGIHLFVDRLEAGLESQVGEFGRYLSGGQRQSIALASALIKNPSILFLDEPTNAMDEIGERQIINTLKKLDSTVVMASHKPAVLSLCDRILVLDKGALVSIKTPQQLFGTNQRKLHSVRLTSKGEQ